MRLVTSVPGLGAITGGVTATEIDTIGRFPASEKLCSYVCADWGQASTFHIGTLDCSDRVVI